MNTLDCIRINLKLKELKKNPKADKLLFCGLQGITIDFNNYRVFYHFERENLKNEHFVLVRSDERVRFRGYHTLKSMGNDFNLGNLVFSKVCGEYGYSWSEGYYKDKERLPSMTQVVNGLKLYYRNMAKAILQGYDQSLIKAYLTNTDIVFGYLVLCLGVDPK